MDKVKTNINWKYWLRLEFLIKNKVWPNCKLIFPVNIVTGVYLSPIPGKNFSKELFIWSIVSYDDGKTKKIKIIIKTK